MGSGKDRCAKLRAGFLREFPNKKYMFTKTCLQFGNSNGPTFGDCQMPMIADAGLKLISKNGFGTRNC